MQPAAMWNLAVADVLADQRPCHRCNQSLSYLRVHTIYHHWRKLFVCLSKGVSTVKLSAKEIEISKKIPKSCSRISAA